MWSNTIGFFNPYEEILSKDADKEEKSNKNCLSDQDSKEN